MPRALIREKGQGPTTYYQSTENQQTVTQLVGLETQTRYTPPQFFMNAHGCAPSLVDDWRSMLRIRNGAQVCGTPREQKNKTVSVEGSASLALSPCRVRAQVASVVSVDWTGEPFQW